MRKTKRIAALAAALLIAATTPTMAAEEDGSWVSLGTYKLTAYCNCRKCCGKWAGGPTSTGTTPEAGRTIAVDPKVIPYGSHILIDGTEYIAEDCGSGIKGARIDVFHDSHSAALEFGVQNKEVFIWTPDGEGV